MMKCGQNPILDADLVGCGRIVNEPEAFRCVDCGVPFHRECARKHFIACESILTEPLVSEQARRDDSREGLRIIVSARDYLNEQMPKNWKATELLNRLWGVSMKEYYRGDAEPPCSECGHPAHYGGGRECSDCACNHECDPLSRILINL